MSFHSYRATYMMEDCEARNDELRQTLNTTLHQLNTTGLNPKQVQWLKGNTTSNVTSGLQKCDIQAFLTDVRVDLNSVILSPWPDLSIVLLFFFFGFMITYTLAALVLIIHDLVIWKCITDRSFPWNFGQMFDKSILDSLIFGQASYFTQHHLCMCLWVTAPNQHQPI